ncbi:putative pumilio domain-protein [Echria macrotheca]|uniref:Pumilio domain-protein n=1 Tax=Echria macrotheca TaxID=438768 RepID=A0AAJ0BD70_9PEZI|nr:putative pumilio domain-protein [Echria macrotheca]
MANGTDKNSQPLTNSFPTTSSWQTSATIWQNNAVGSFNKPRDVAGAKDSSEAFPKISSGSSALAASSEPEGWANGARAWNNTESTLNRNTSGNTSPNRARIEAPIRDLNNDPYYITGLSHIQPAIGQRAQARPKTGTASDAPAGSFNVSQLNTDYGAESGDGSPYSPLNFGTESNGANGYSTAKRPSQDISYARDPLMPTSSHSETDLHTHGSAFGDLAFAGQTHSQRPSVSSFSQASRMFNGLGQLDRDVENFVTAPGLNDGPATITNGMGNLSFGNGQAQSPFNPMSQPWATGGPALSEFPRDTYGNSASFERRGSAAERGSPAGSTYRQTLRSPTNSYTGTPQQPSDAWARPASRDPRNVPELDRRPHNQSFIPQPSGYYGNPYQSNGFSPYAAQYYDPYPQSLRGHVPMAPGYVLPMHPYMPGSGIPPLRPGRDQDPVRAMASPLLTEFKTNYNKASKKWELRAIFGHIVEFSGDQAGSRLIQEKLETANSDDKDHVFREIEPNALQLMKDLFGNYVIQKLFEHGNQVQKKILAGVMKGKVVDLSVQMYACRVVQKALEHVLVEQQAELVKELEPEILKVLKDQNGNHVVQKIIELVPRQHIDFIMNCFKGRVSELSSHSFGCRVIQRALEKGTEADKAAMMSELHSCITMLITDQFGNYVAQHVIAHGTVEDRDRVIDVVTNELVHYSKHKFASNVVEACIAMGTPTQVHRIREILSQSVDDANGTLPVLVRDSYGNYVIQKLLKQLNMTDREAGVEFAERLRPIVVAAKKTNSGRQIAQIMQLLDDTLSAPPSTSNPTSPTLRVDVESTVPTPPVLTMGHNSPSSSPPSTNDGAIGDVGGAPLHPTKPAENGRLEA